MTEVEGSRIHDIHHLTMVYIIYSVWVDYINDSVPGIAFLNFEGG